MNFNLPEYCDYYKFTLVEELALCANPALIHYGKCSVIGFLSKSKQGSPAMSVGSLTVPHLKRCHQVPDCTFNVRLLMSFHPFPQLNTTVEIFGEVRLFDPTSATETDLESAHSLVQRLRELQMRLEEDKGLPPRAPSGTNDKGMNSTVKCKLQKEIEEFKKRFKPIIQVDTIRHVKEAHEIIAENLRFRQLQNTRKGRLKKN